jgi:hypothetical protein
LFEYVFSQIKVEESKEEIFNPAKNFPEKKCPRKKCPRKRWVGEKNHNFINKKPKSVQNLKKILIFRA